MKNIMYTSILNLLILVCLTSANHPVSETHIRDVLVNHFSFNRHHAVNATAKQMTRDYIIKKFSDYGMMVELNNFTATVPGQNIIGILKGSNFGTAADNITGIVAHYDTVRNSSGVDDNGAAMSVMLEVARVISDQYKGNMCTLSHTLAFIAPDYEEWDWGSNSSCTSGLCGSQQLRQWWLQFQTKHYASGAPTVNGFVVMDTIMNFNDSENSQQIPNGFDLSFPTQTAEIKSRNMTGDFITVVGRAGVPLENTLLQDFIQNWGAQTASTKYRSLSVPIPLIPGFTSTPAQIRILAFDLTRSDHYSFWEGGIPAIFITDTANFRGTMQQCYHQECDNVDSITDDKIGFLKQTADTLVSLLDMKGEGVCVTTTVKTTTIATSSTQANLGSWCLMLTLVAAVFTLLHN